MLMKLPLPRLRDKAVEMTRIAGQMEKLNAFRLARLVEINADLDHTLAWKTTAAEPFKRSPEIEALNSQVKLLVAVVSEQKKLWRDSSALLRDAAVPTPDGMGRDSYTAALAELNFLMGEANALSQNATALQSALDRAVLAGDWKATYALTLGRINQFGQALADTAGFNGTPLDPLPLPGRDESEAIFLEADLAEARAAGVMLALSSGDMNPTAPSSSTRLVRDSAMARIQRQFDEAADQRDRLRAATSALERWELYKNGAPAPEDFDSALAAATARARAEVRG